MSEDWFDELARAAARGLSRRQTLKLLAGVFLSGLVGARSGFRPAVARADGGCAETLVPWYPGCLQAVAKFPPVPPPLTGCELPVLTFPPVPGVNFYPACVTLDRCYGECGKPQVLCDTDLLLDMQTACLTQIPPADPEAQLAQALCLGYALQNFELQQALGVVQYDAAQSAVCDCCGCDSDAQCEQIGPGLKCCSRKCVDTQTDANNCGSCGHACAPGEACVGGVCEAGPFYFHMLSEQYSTHGTSEPSANGQCPQVWGNDLTDASLPSPQTGAPTNVLDISGGQWTGQILATLSGMETLHVHGCNSDGSTCDQDLPPGTGPFSDLGIQFSGATNSDPIVQWPVPEYFISSGQGPVCTVDESIASANYLDYQQSIPLAKFTSSQPVTLTFSRTEKLTATIGPAVTIDSTVSYSITFQRVNSDGSPYTG